MSNKICINQFQPWTDGDDEPIFRDMTAKEKKEAKKEYDRKRYLAKIDLIKEQHHLWYLDNKEICKEKHRIWSKENKELNNKNAKIWQKNHPWYSAFNGAKQRCQNSKDDGYKYYGGRGIKFLMTMEDFEYLWFRDKAYLMKHPSIDRENNNGHYELSNCKYIEKSENTRKMWKDTGRA